MKNIYITLLLIFAGSLIIRAQQQITSYAKSFYIGTHIGTPLFWGDLSSTGEKFRPGYGGGLLAGYRFTDWLAIEINTDYMTGKTGAAKWQTNDFIDNQGVIRYTQGTYKLGDVYSKIRLSRYGLRFPVQILKIFRSKGNFNIEITPHAYLNNFYSGIYNIKNNQKLTDGAPPRSVSYSLGGDIGLSYRIHSGSVIFLRSSFSRISDDRYDAVTTSPAWKENFMLYIGTGIQFDLGKSEKKQREIQETIPSQQLPQEYDPTTSPQISREPEVIHTDTIPHTTETIQPIPTLYFKRNSYTIDLQKYHTTLTTILQIIEKYNTYSVVIEAWADTTGTAKYNKKITLLRAQAIADYLITNSTDPSHIKVYGKGEDYSSANHEESRRAELKLITTD